MMGDECNCEKCGAGQFYSQGRVWWPLEGAEMPGEGRGRPPREHFIIVGERGIALRRQPAEFSV